MSKYSELADLMEKAEVKSGFEWRAAAALRELEAHNEELQSQIGLSELVINRFKAENDQLRDELAAAFAAGLKIEQRAGKSEAERDRLQELNAALAGVLEKSLMNPVLLAESGNRDIARELIRRAALEDKE